MAKFLAAYLVVAVAGAVWSVLSAQRKTPNPSPFQFALLLVHSALLLLSAAYLWLGA